MPTAISNLFWYKTSEQKQSSSTVSKFRKGNTINSQFFPLPQRAKLVQHWHMSYIHHCLILLDHLKHFCVNKPRVITPGPSVFLFSSPMIPAGRTCTVTAALLQHSRKQLHLLELNAKSLWLGLRHLSCFPSVSIDRATLFYVTLWGIQKEKSCQVTQEI